MKPEEVTKFITIPLLNSNQSVERGHYHGVADILYILSKCYTETRGEADEAANRARSMYLTFQ